MLKIAVLVSGGGTNLQAIIDSIKNGKIKDAEIAVVISNKKNAFALERAKACGIKTEVILKKQFLNKDKDEISYENAMINIIKSNNAQLVVLAGFTAILSENFIKAFPNKIINVHPSLIPSFCGQGYYGLNVHKAAIEYGVKVTGATVHYVNEIVDGGAIIAQKAVNVFPNDTPETLQKRVMEEAEHIILPEVINYIVKNYNKK